MNRFTAKGVKPQVSAEVSVPTGTSAAIVASAPAIDATVGVLLTAPSANTVTVYVGPSGVTVSNGTPVDPGKSITIPVANPADIYSISGSAAQKLRVMWV
jgi:hypothetical protein